MSIPVLSFRVTRAVTQLGAFGTMWHRSSPVAIFVPFAVTLEKVYEKDGRYSTKVPDGLWYCSKRRYNKGGYDSFEIRVPNHEFILFHKGNYQDDSDGCPLIAEQYHDFGTWEDPNPGIGNSKGGFEEFKRKSLLDNHFFCEFKTNE